MPPQSTTALQSFMATMEILGINPYVRVTAARAKALKPGWRKAMPVRVRINGKPEKAWPINMMPKGDGSFLLYLHASVRKASGTGVGDRVRVEVAFDADYAGGPAPMPTWFREALRRELKVGKAFQALPPSRKKELVRYLALLKSPEARERNLVQALRVLSGEPGRFMARDWKDGK
ncbi:MAG: YdeI/OmpD-associated family protein [Fibrobacteria bacterium]